MQPWLQRQPREVRLIAMSFAIVVIAAVGIISLASCGSSSAKSAAETSASEAEINELADEVEEEEAEGAEEAMNPSIPHNFEEVVIAHPRNEESTAAQLRQQIITNEESNDPTHQQEASCSWLSEYGHYVHYECMGYTLGGTSDAIGRVELTVNTNTGEVLVEGEE